ncbi:histidine kinase [Pontiellaceae bacterium B12227]|nr:histidine kinase [Pontiellaceae bacterium B12227]
MRRRLGINYNRIQKELARLLILFVGLSAPLSVYARSPEDISISNRSMKELEERLAEIDTELQHLASYSLRSGIGSIGYRSSPLPVVDAEIPEWVSITFDREYTVDAVVLVPTLWRHREKGFIDDGFPTAFKVISGTDENTNGTVIAEFSDAGRHLPRIAPLFITIPETSMSWIKIEASGLSKRAYDDKEVLQLSELLVFSGTENVALRQPVDSRTSGEFSSGAWRQQFLVDGSVPYLMDAAGEDQSLAYISERGKRPELTLDLEQAYPLNRIQLHAVDQSDTVPQAFAGDLGMPRHLVIQGSNRADFSDAQTLLDFRWDSIHETGPLMAWRIPETICRYVKIIAEESGDPVEKNSTLHRIGFAEIELFSGGLNAALNKKTLEAESLKKRGRTPIALTDGLNLYGRILPVRDWMEQLARRHDLETERPLIEAELNRRYARQKTNLNRMYIVAALLLFGIGIAVLLERLVHMRQLAQIKERFAADLHDELGANVHSIGLMSDFAQTTLGSPDHTQKILSRIRALSDRTGTAIRHFSDMQEDKELYLGLSEDMQRAAQRITARFEHDMTIEGDEYLKKLKPRIRVDLFLFYKECLVNIYRHSEATRFATHLTATASEVVLTVSDNGIGINSPDTPLPRALKRRARLLRAKLTVETPKSGGTSITLRLSRHWKPRTGQIYET